MVKASYWSLRFDLADLLTTIPEQSTSFHTLKGVACHLLSPFFAVRLLIGRTCCCQLLRATCSLMILKMI